MPLPLIIGVAALGAAAFGAKKGYDGYQKHSEADEIVDNAEKKYRTHKNVFESHEEKTTNAFTELGTQELDIGKQFNEFNELATELLEKLNNASGKRLAINIPAHKLQKIENYSYTAVGVLGTAAGAGIGGIAAGFAVYGGVMTLGAASTGTAIASLSGVAATNATLAAIGGGSLATGGLGMAGGTAILGGAVAAPILAIAGWAYDKHGEESLDNARKIRREVNEAVEKLETMSNQHLEIQAYISKVKDAIDAIYIQFEEYFDSLRLVSRVIKNAQKTGANVSENLKDDSIITDIENGYALAAIIVDIIETPIFKVNKKDDQVVIDENGAPSLQTDKDGFNILNSDEIDVAISNANSEAAKY
ncbi:hypothetical protein KDN34_05565 [Shewanella yunxiaonensis]|uniref:Chemotaxis protein n=1 Tax=Shewanella yunxiaonensis TaxID=2829809 RepID=A0ABX7YVW3_9GAMM|nr:hypothetical protein [Shewanella yunxiaonensis]QUN06913.1 hypothetical protein KDN34_05565 [Shewanella yunxiaonensis]